MKRFVKDANAVKDYQIDWLTKGFLGADTITISTFTAAEDSWVTLKTYLVGERVRLASGAVLEATVGGKSAGSAPTAPAVGSTVVDGTITWLRSFDIASSSNTTTTATIWVAGGTVGREYVAINHITTAAGRQEDEELVFVIIEK